MEITARDEEFLKGLRRSTHWSENDARRALELAEAAGEPRARFARRYGLRSGRLAWWKRRLGSTDQAQESSPTSPVEFVELVSSACEPRPAALLRMGAVEVELWRLDLAAARFVATLASLAEKDACS